MNDPQVIEAHPPRTLMTVETPLRNITLIAELKPGVKNLNCTFIILEKAQSRTAANGHTHCSFKVSDESGCINLTLWDEAVHYLQPGDVCSLKCGSTSVYKGVMSLNCGKNSEILKTGRIIHHMNLTPDMSAFSEEYERMYSNNNKSMDENDCNCYANVIKKPKLFKIPLTRVKDDISRNKPNYFNESLYDIKKIHDVSIASMFEMRLNSEKHQRFKNYLDVEYVGNIYLGSNKQRFQVVLDTGSSDFWVPNENCTARCHRFCQNEVFRRYFCASQCSFSNGKMPEEVESCGDKKRFITGNSETFESMSQYFSVLYGTGSAQGQLGTDDVWFGNPNDDNSLRVNKVTFGRAFLMAEFFENTYLDGILGLGFTSLSGGQIDPPFVKAYKDGLVSPIFTVWMKMSPVNDRRGADGGQITYGGIDEDHCENSNLIEVELENAGYWQFVVEKIVLRHKQDTKDREIGPKEFSAISDTGTSYLVVDNSIVKEIAEVLHASVDRYGTLTADCTEQFSLKFHVKNSNGYDRVLELTHEHLLVKRTMSSSCIVAVAGQDGDGVAILGTPLMRAYYVVKVELTKSLPSNVRKSGETLDLLEGNDYVGNITIGDPPQNFTVAFDINLGNVWVPDIECECTAKCKIPFMCKSLCKTHCCTKKASVTDVRVAIDDKFLFENAIDNIRRSKDSFLDPVCKDKHKYDSTLSGTYGTDDRYWEINYIGGKASGKLAQDSLSVGRSLRLPHTTIGLATEFPEEYKESRYDGVYGLARQTTVAYHNVESPMFQAVRLGLLDENMISLWLNSKESEPAGYIAFGGVDNEHCSLISEFEPTVDDYSWKMEMKKIRVDSVAAENDWKTELDLSYPYVGGPRNILEMLSKPIGATYDAFKDTYYVSCNAEFNVVLTFNQQEYPISSQLLIVKEITNKDGLCLLAFKNYYSVHSDWRLGSPFLKQYCVVLDFSGQIGIALTY
ncbi:unnamed protein product [Bursaphelenchus okinawaensis]|uniref:Peptidase A1 domain-containing protein n=1 Tax=Bursaphelenchus okinawaensis TaxID=465554 RepID=A0A811KZH0_9BILA|nr:unnamed protein product [Bursaphelenchus okinawaensis]CAG9114848.1 unnamed protein product [Bursaphelenchus okinawaensis]